MSDDKKSAAERLVEIACDLYVFGCVYDQRGHTSRIPGDDKVAVFCYATPKNQPGVKRPLPDIRADLAAVYQATYDKVPPASALGDAMVVLDGKAQASAPTEADPDTLAMLLTGGRSNIATQLVKLAQEHYRFGTTETGLCFAVPIDGPNIARPLRGGRRSLRAELARMHWEKTKSAAGSQALADALLALEGQAQTVDPEPVVLRVGRDPAGDRLVLDLGDDQGNVAVISRYGWEVTDKSPVTFMRTAATLPVPMPTETGSITPLRDMLNIADTDWPLVLGWLVAALFPDIPHPVLLLKGEQGTAKSTAARLLTSLVDRCASQLRTAPRNVEDWAVAAAGSWITCMDNVSDIQPWLQDAICRASTGDGLLRRALYSDSDVSVLAFRRAVAITSIEPGGIAGDLADRLLTVELERIPDPDRTSEADMDAHWSAVSGDVLGGLLQLTVEVLRELETVRHSNLPRMADFARILIALDHTRGTDAYATYAAQSGSTAEQVVDSDSVAVAIRGKITAPWTGPAQDLLALLTADRPPKDWPTTPQGMGGRLARVAPVLRRIGWTVERGRRGDSKGTRQWSLRPPGWEESPAGSSGMAEVTEPQVRGYAGTDDTADDPGLFDPRNDRGPDNAGDAGDPAPTTAAATSAPLTSRNVNSDSTDDLAGHSSYPPTYCRVCDQPAGPDGYCGSTDVDHQYARRIGR